MVNTGEITIKSLKEQSRMAIEELRFYHQELLKSNNLSYFLNIQKRMIFLMKIILKVERLSQKRSLKVINNKSYRINKPIIYLFTTAGEYDVETAIEIASGASLVNVTKQQSIIQKIESLLLMSNRLLETDSLLTKDELLKFRLENMSLGHNDISFPELIANKEPFTSVNQLNPEIAELIIKSDASVIPIALEQYKVGNKVNCLANIGENFNLSGLKTDYIDDILKIIYDELTKLKQEIWLKISTGNLEPQLVGSNPEKYLSIKL